MSRFIINERMTSEAMEVNYFGFTKCLILIKNFDRGRELIQTWSMIQKYILVHDWILIQDEL